MEEKVLFDASSYPAYQDHLAEILASWKRFTYLAIIGSMVTGFVTLYMILEFEFYEWPLILAIFVLMYLMIAALVLFIIFKMPKIMR